jgi:hypothetical protein
VSKPSPKAKFWSLFYFTYAGHLIPPKRIDFGKIMKNPPEEGGGTRVTILGRSQEEKDVWKTLGENNEDMVEWIVICSALTVLDDEIIKATQRAEGERGLARLRPAPGSTAEVPYRAQIENQVPQLDAEGPAGRGRAISRKGKERERERSQPPLRPPPQPQRANTYDAPRRERDGLPQLARLELHDNPVSDGPLSAPVHSRAPDLTRAASSNESFLTAQTAPSSASSPPAPYPPSRTTTPYYEPPYGPGPQQGPPRRLPSPRPIPPPSSRSRSRRPARDPRAPDDYRYEYDPALEGLIPPSIAYDASGRPIPPPPPPPTGYDPRQQQYPQTGYPQPPPPQPPHGHYNAPPPQSQGPYNNAPFPPPETYGPPPTDGYGGPFPPRAPSSYRPGSRGPSKQPVRSA